MRKFVSINGQVVTIQNDAKISIWDTSFHRGDGVFEVMRLLPNGNIRSLFQHLARLKISANAVGCPLPSHKILNEWLNEAAAACSGGCLRLIATKGGATADDDVPSSVIISWSPLPTWPATFTLLPLLAPWHPAGAVGWETPIKWTSYGPNVVSTRKAQQAGFTDALLLSNDRLRSSSPHHQHPPLLEYCHVLDGPNFAVGWIIGNILHIPCCETLGLLPSITQTLVAELAVTKLQLEVKRGVYRLQDVLSADEVFVMSTTRGAIPVTQIGTTTLPQSSPSKNARANQLSKLLDQLQE
jgi:branched-subunit amino acid aminotransferase/4-amino-4-deoxychorismate lyase